MPCEWLRTPDGTVVHVNRGRTRGQKMRCKFCHKDYYGGKLCDFPIGNGRTCDAAMCDECSRTLGAQEREIGDGFARMRDTIDVCPIHREQAVVTGGALHAKTEAR